METAGVLPFVAGIGPFQMSHVWMLKLKNAEATERVLAEGALEVKKRYCAVIEPNKRELAFRVHWVPFYGSNESVQKAFEEFGEVNDVTREQWNSPGFEDAEWTTRLPPELPAGNEKSQGYPTAETTGEKVDAAAPPEEPTKEGTTGDHDSEAPMDAAVAFIKRPRDYEKAPATD
ncbi:hypothetical protein V5799_028175 [Amblyomma americanum]|uniref:Uncharacterized protein n=1 Tax=Amblyomma americanum TaxID=6943 RepID=A0AAQ4DDL9_AMBAM